MSTELRALLAIEDESTDLTTEQADELQRLIEEDPALSADIEADPGLDPLFHPNLATGAASVDPAADAPSALEWRAVDVAIAREIRGESPSKRDASPHVAPGAPGMHGASWLRLAATLVVGIGLGALGLSALPEPTEGDALRASLAIPESEDLPDDARDWNIDMDDDAVMIRISTD